MPARCPADGSGVVRPTIILLSGAYTTSSVLLSSIPRPGTAVALFAASVIYRCAQSTWPFTKSRSGAMEVENTSVEASRGRK